MFRWFCENISTIGVCAVIALFAVLAVISAVRSRKKGKTCSCGCEGCLYSGSCKDTQNQSGGKT